MSEEGGLLVIGAGLSRTGTTSTRLALEILLNGKCAHMVGAQLMSQEWRDILLGKATDDEFKFFFKKYGFVAAVDVPFICVLERAIKLFPEAKVLLTERDPESWSRSATDTLVASMKSKLTYLHRFLTLFPIACSYLIVEPLFDRVWLNTELAREFIRVIDNKTGVEFYNEWVKKVEGMVEKERLLKYSVKEGWKPLCEFLDVDIPNTPFPNENSTQRFYNWMNLRKRRERLLLFEFVTFPLCIYFFSRNKWQLW